MGLHSLALLEAWTDDSACSIAVVIGLVDLSVMKMIFDKADCSDAERDGDVEGAV
jgi:hypothetical protein